MQVQSAELPLVSHMSFVKTDGSLRAMGNNLFGQLGDGTTNQRTPQFRFWAVKSRMYVLVNSTVCSQDGWKPLGDGRSNSGQLGDSTY